MSASEARRRSSLVRSTCGEEEEEPLEEEDAPPLLLVGETSAAEEDAMPWLWGCFIDASQRSKDGVGSMKSQPDQTLLSTTVSAILMSMR
mmetsp:Transcript_892/g.2009  ORF Transcript_892/g.2009 Transcript_892/m.2009 type:complete len:90 (+) Transcript_892:421-690(+)